MAHRRTLIEVALPLPEINDASAYDKMPGIGPHPKGIHQWWARLPLPTARAVLFASVVTDPADDPAWRDKPEEEQDLERERLFGIIRRMMGKKLHEHPEVYAEANAEIRKHCGGKLPTVLDPFAGGGSIPLEANRLGFTAEAADLNPVAVLLNKCNLEIAPRWAGHPPVNPEARKRVGGTSGTWRGTQGLAADVRYYGEVIRQRAIKKIGHLYPNVQVIQEKDGTYRNATPEGIQNPQSKIQNLPVIAWIWARTVASPNPAARGKHVPLISTYWLSSKKGNLAWLEPIVDKAAGTYRFEVKTGTPTDRSAVSAGTKAGRGTQFSCILTEAPITPEYLRAEGMAGRYGQVLIAVVAEVHRGRGYVAANRMHAETAATAIPEWFPEEELSTHPQYMGVPRYGLTRFGDLFTSRQLLALGTFSALVRDTAEDVRRDSVNAGLAAGEAESYSRAVTTILALIVDRCADFNNALCRWKASGQQTMQLFGRQAISMVWDFVEPNIMGEKAVCWATAVEIGASAVDSIVIRNEGMGRARQVDAASGVEDLDSLLVSTDPPYYDNVPYSDLSDFFYVWLRPAIGDRYRELFGTMLAPKKPELVASTLRHGGDRNAAKEHFESGFRRTFTLLRERLDARFPLTVYYAFKQSDQETDESDGATENSPSGGIDLTTGWETLLEALVSSGFQITATWPVRASQQWRMRAMGSNALASYIVLACRARADSAPQIGRREFMTQLKRELPEALRHLQQGNVAPVDLAQAAIGPGMAVFSRYARVVESSGQAMCIRAALAMINQMLDEVLAEQEGDFDADSRWAVAWFDQHGFGEAEYGTAETLSKAKNTSVTGMAQAGILASHAGKVRLLRPNELPADWAPAKDKRLTAWEAVHHLVRVLEAGGESATAGLVAKLGGSAEVARELAYRLFTLCERRKRPAEALSYNALVQSWPEIARLAREQAVAGPQQQELGF